MNDNQKYDCPQKYECPLCEEIFGDKVKYNKHIKQKKPCSKKKLKRESARDRKKKPYACLLCEDRFSYKSSRNRHQKQYCPMIKRTPEDWVKYTSFLKIKNKKTEKERDEYYRKYRKGEKKIKHLSREYNGIRKILQNFSKSAPDRRLVGFDSESSETTEDLSSETTEDLSSETTEDLSSETTEDLSSETTEEFSD